MKTLILVVDAEPEPRQVFRSVLSHSEYDVHGVAAPSRALELISAQDFDLVVSDVTLPESSGIEFCQRSLRIRSGLPVVLMSAESDVDIVIDAMRAGAVDFLKKPLDSAGICVAVERALTAPGVRRSVDAWTSTRSHNPRAHRQSPSIRGESAVMQRVHESVSSLSNSLVSVLLQGETGTGKEVLARAIHQGSSVSNGPFVAVNCAAMPAGLLESTLFGHARGAFTDAKRSSRGLFVEADGGTLLLDEIGELPLEMQPKLLRALQERAVRPVGGQAEVPFDCRLITATNRDLEQAVASHQFREDLYYRLDVLRITVPPLRERGDDVIALARHFAARFAAALNRNVGLSPSFERILLGYAWPGNVRELENCMQYAVTMARSHELTVGDLPTKIGLFEANAETSASARQAFSALSLSELERQHILHAVQLSAGNRSAAARLLGIDRRTLQRRLKNFRHDDLAAPRH